MRLIAIALGWVTGIVLAAGTQLTLAAPWLALAGMALLVVWLIWSRSGYRNLSLALLAFALGGLRYTLVAQTSNIAQYNNLGGMTIEGTIVAEPDVRDDRVDLRLAADSVTRIGTTTPINGTILVQVPGTTPVRFGDRIAATGELIIPSVSDTFSYRDYLARSGIFSIMQNASVTLIDTGANRSFFRVLFDLKDRARNIIALSLPEPSAGLLTGILLGDSRGLSPEVSDTFSAVGASHIIAISGFNMAILSGVVMGLLNRLKVARRPSALIALLVIALYTLLVGATPSVVRAAIMSSLLVFGGLIRRKSYVPTSLAFVALLMSIQNPTILWDVGFQLSFFATLGLALFATPLTRWLDTQLQQKFPKPTARLVGEVLGDSLMVSISAQIMTLPLILLYFERLSIVALLVNVLIVPVQSYLMIVGLVATLLAFAVPALAQLLFWLDMLLLGWTLGIVREFSRLPFAETTLKVDSRLIAGFYLLVMGGALMLATKPSWIYSLAYIIRRRVVIATTAVSVAGLTVLWLGLVLSRPDGMLHVWWLDVGHSNAVLVQTPAGAHILIDGGRLPSRLLTALGDRLPFNDRQLEILVISQPDPFDYTALSSVMERYAVGKLLTNGQPNLNPDYAAIVQQLPVDTVVPVRAGYSLDVQDRTRLEILSPMQTPNITDKLNEAALVLRITYQNISFLLPSDLSVDGQIELLKSAEWPLATVLQLPNHGGIRSLEQSFLTAVQPQVAIVQADPTNRLGDPDPDTLSLLGNTPLYRTDHSGTLHFWTNGQTLWAVPSK